MGLTTKWVLSWIAAAAQTLEAQKASLNELDAVIGDGDHGDNLARGFAAVDQKLSNYLITTPRKALHTAGVVLLAAVGGASGPLWGTAFMRASKAVPKDAPEIGSQEVAMMLVKAAEGITERGGAQPGGKTMLDAWYPAATNGAAALAKGANCSEILRVAAAAAEKGAQSTLSLTAEKGRASILGERSIGHLDPGAISTAWILQVAARTAAGIEDPDSLNSPDSTSPLAEIGAPNVVQDVLKNIEKSIPANRATGADKETPGTTPSRETETASLMPASHHNVRGLMGFTNEAKSFADSARRLLVDDEPETSGDEATGTAIASALGIGLAAESDAESAYAN